MSSDMLIGDVVDMASLNLPSRRGGGRTSELVTRVRSLQPGNALTITVPAGSDFDAVASSVSSKVYRKNSDKTHAVGFAPRVERDFDNRTIYVVRPATSVA